MLENSPPFSKSIPQIVNKHFLRLANQNTKPTSSFTSPEVSWMSLDRDNSFFEPKNSKVRKLKKRNFWKYVHSPNSELVVSFSWYFQKHLFTTSQADIRKQLPTCLFFSVGAVTGGHAGRLSWLETPQHPQVAPVGMGRCISRTCGWNTWKIEGLRSLIRQFVCVQISPMKHGTNRWENCTSWTPKGWPTNFSQKISPKENDVLWFFTEQTQEVSGLCFGSQ